MYPRPFAYNVLSHVQWPPISTVSSLTDLQRPQSPPWDDTWPHTRPKGPPSLHYIVMNTDDRNAHIYQIKIRGLSPQMIKIQGLSPRMSCMECSYSPATISPCIEDRLTHTPLACRVPGPFQDSCTTCIVRVARATSATTSNSTVANPVDSSWAPPDVHVTQTHYTLKSKVTRV